MASRSRPTNHRMFRGRARSSKWFVRSCSRLVPCWHWPWSLATLRPPSAGLRRLVVPRLHVVHPHRAALLQAVPLLVVTAAALPQAVPLLAGMAAVLLRAALLLAVLAVPLQAVQLLLAAAVQPLLLPLLQLLRTLQSLPQLKRSSQLNLLAGSLTACDSPESRAVFRLSPLQFPGSGGEPGTR